MCNAPIDEYLNPWPIFRRTFYHQPGVTQIVFKCPTRPLSFRETSSFSRTRTGGDEALGRRVGSRIYRLHGPIAGPFSTTNPRYVLTNSLHSRRPNRLTLNPRIANFSSSTCALPSLLLPYFRSSATNPTIASRWSDPPERATVYPQYHQQFEYESIAGVLGYKTARPMSAESSWDMDGAVLYLARNSSKGQYLFLSRPQCEKSRLQCDMSALAATFTTPGPPSHRFTASLLHSTSNVVQGTPPFRHCYFLLGNPCAFASILYLLLQAVVSTTVTVPASCLRLSTACFHFKIFKD
ncbi:hypothetical protein IW262DRAFT_482691 [Armillaria fumosa]|nr:hypothetical protein IW262DRAFT_482691 [Armillaria fumosa]